MKKSTALSKLMLISFLLVHLTSFSQIDLDVKLPPATEELSKSFKTYLNTNNISKTKIGVLEFEDNSEKQSEMGVFLCNEMTTWLSLYSENKYTVVSQQDINKIIQQKEASTKYRTNKDKIEILKKYKLIDYVLTATITQFSEQYRISVRVLSTNNSEAGSVVAVKIFNINRTKDLDDMYSKKNESDLKADNEDNKSRGFMSNNVTNNDFKVGEILEGEAIGSTKYQSVNNTYSILVNCNGKKMEVYGISSWYANLIDANLSYPSQSVIINFKYKVNGTGEYLSYEVKMK